MSLENSAINLLSQLRDTIESLKPSHFSSPVEVLSSSTVGQHMRHTVEFFICLMDSFEGGEICYDKRKHDTIIETNSKIAVNVIISLKDFISKETLDRPLIYSASNELDSDEQITLKSSYLRELAYCIDHAIHHMAFIKIAIRQQFDYVSLPTHFGVASSTVRYQQREKD